MKIGYTVWTWIIRLFEETHTWEPKSNRSRLDFEEAIRSIAHLGYTSVECFNQIVDIYDGADAEFDILLKEYGISFECIYLYLSEDSTADVATAEKCFIFMKRHNIPFANLQASARPEGRVPTREEVKKEADKARQIGVLGKQYGVTVCLHPHLGTMVENKQDIDWFAEFVNAEDVSFCFDTAHILTGGMNVVDMFSQYVSRMPYVHLKDVSATLEPGQTQFDRFRPVGEGIVDFTGVLEVLKNHGYRGVLCVEVDNPQVCNYEAAQTSIQYLKKLEAKGY
ncbi:MAG: sugar phosphate isomerase/epimerase [Treponema sp.]|jgi:inosose dehydratase|nr:sugar phosphate isomerase/epimerase [Treponema sp.]